MEVLINGVRFVAERLPECRKKKFNELIKEARLNNMQTIHEAARAIETTKSRLWELEKGGTMPTLPMLQKILKHYDLQFDEIADV